MKNQLFAGSVLALLSTLNTQLYIAYAQGTAFTYQGRLNDGANGANGTYDVRFAIYHTLTLGSQQGSILTNSATAVSNGLFTARLDFGNQFPGANRWLEVGMRTNGNGAFTTPVPRQQLTPTPYAITAGNISGSITATQLPASVLTNGSSGVNISGTFTGNGVNVTNVNASSLGGLSSSGFWSTNGNAGANPADGAFIGTTDNLPLDFKANGQRVLRLTPATNSAYGYAPNVRTRIKDAYVVKRYGLHQLPELFAHLNPMPFTAEVQKEQNLADAQ